MAKYEVYSRRRLRARFKAWARQNWRTVLVICAGAVTLLLFETWLFVAFLPSSPITWYAMGALHSVIVAACLLGIASAFLVNEGEAIWQLRGAWGEEATRDELKRARRRRVIWGWVDSITLQAGDIDHLVVTRHAGLVAADSKWRNQHTAEDRLDMARAASRARLRAEALTRTLLASERTARHRSTTNPLAVRPVVVLWGAAQHEVPDGAQVDGIEFVAGRRFVAWLEALEGQTVTKEAGADVVSRLSDYRARTWDQTREAKW